MSKKNILGPLPVLPLKDVVIFPKMIVPLFVGRQKTIKALESALKQDKQIFLVTQKSSKKDAPKATDLYEVGTVGHVLQMLKLPDGTIKVLVEGKARAEIVEYTDNKAHFEVFYRDIEEEIVQEDAKEEKALIAVVKKEFADFVKLNKSVAPEVMVDIEKVQDSGRLADLIATHLAIANEGKQALLEIPHGLDRLETVYDLITQDIGVLELEQKIRGRVKNQMEKNQREYYLNEQVKAIQKELSSGDGYVDDIDELEKRIKGVKFTKEAQTKIEAEMKKLRSMSPMSAEATVVRGYIDWMLDIPWQKKKRVNKKLDAAEKVLEADHFGLEKVKDRILEYLAVQHRVGKVKGPILCLVGPPGVGKTSLGRSIASATGREYVRVALGGVRDESEIRGHRKTYIGSMPGRIIQGMKKAKCSNPLFLLDEIDKLGSDHRGDPAAALLEVLDPEQNNAFNDHYLEVDYDLSDVLFVCTANSVDIPEALLDRMEMIRISGYTEQEKMSIAKIHLLPKQLEMHGLKPAEISVSEKVIEDIIRYYTREAGVRSLEREIAKICRKVTKEIVLAKTGKKIAVSEKNLKNYLGVRKYNYGIAEEEDLIGVTTGLAWTQVGGELLQIEAVTIPGKGKTSVTGKLGDVMKESIEAAHSYVKSRAVDYGIHPLLMDKRDIHLHVPEGATPKDGPSAGVGMVTSIVSVLTNIAVRKDIAMTGEVTLRGRVLPIGGLKEKLLAALRGQVKTVLIPDENQKDLEEIPDIVKKGLEIIPVKTVDEVLKHALVKDLEKINWDEEAFFANILAESEKKHTTDVIKH